MENTVLDNAELQERLAKSLHNCVTEALILSAFVKYDALEWLADHIRHAPALTIVVRWRMGDLLSGASDLQIFNLCKSKGWGLRIDQSLHGKLYLLDDDLYVGSANLTRSGISIGASGNYELIAKLTANEIKLDKLQRYVNSTTVVDDTLYSALEDALADAKKEYINTQVLSWPDDIQQTFKNVSVEDLWVDDLLFSKPLVSSCTIVIRNTHDADLLGVAEEENLNVVSQAFEESKLYLWLLANLKGFGESSLRFGRISKLLHAALMDDERIYRKDVKSFVDNLFAWVEALKLPNLSIINYTHTRAIELKDK